MRVRSLFLGAITVAMLATVIPMVASAEEPPCEWLAGDFHVHTVYSHDAYGGPEDAGTGHDEFYTLGWTPGQQGAIAESRDLDFLAITDHDNVDGYLARDEAATGLGLYESGWGRTDQLPGGDPLVWVPDYEANVAGGGHAQMHGATKTYPKAPAPDMAAAIQADGGAFQINHPSDGDWHVDGEYEHGDFAPDALEVWNIGAWLYHPPLPATNDHEFPVAMYDDFLDAGKHVAATGGSDNHWRSTTAAQGVGQPTTWVCAEDRTAEAIIAGVKAGRTTISNQPPAYMGPIVKLYSNNGNTDDRFESILGSTVLPGSDVVASVENGDGATLRFVTNGGTTLHEETIHTFNFSVEVDVPEKLEDGTPVTWVRAELFYKDAQDVRRENQAICDTAMQVHSELNEAPGVIHEDAAGNSPLEDENYYCQNRLAMMAMTSPIYFAAPTPTETVTPSPTFNPATTLTYTGDEMVRVNKTATFAAELTDAEGTPMVGETVTFTFRGETLTATTDDLGVATTQTRVKNPQGQEVLHIDYAGSAVYAPSHLEQIITITNGRG